MLTNIIWYEFMMKKQIEDLEPVFRMQNQILNGEAFFSRLDEDDEI